MLGDFWFSVSCVLPIFIMIILGYWIANKTPFLDETTQAKVNGLVFQFALPVLLFRDISRAQFSDVFDAKLVLFAIITTISIFFFSWGYGIIRLKEKNEIGVFVQGCFRGNYAIIGLPVIANVLGGTYSGRAALITSFVVPLYNILSILVLSVYDSRNENGVRLNWRTVGNSIFANPLIRGIMIGIPFSVFGWKLPAVADTCVNYMAGLASPLALIIIGAAIDFSRIKAKFVPAMYATVVKLVVCPLVFIPIAMSMGMTGENLVVLYVMYANPTAVSSYVMAANMGGDRYLAANIVLLTTLFSVFSFTVGIFVMKSLGIV